MRRLRPLDMEDLIHLQSLPHRMRDEDHRHLALEGIDGLGEALGGLLIQRAGGFVNNQHLGPLD